MSKNFRQNTIALVYDFDGTLSPEPMQNQMVRNELQTTPENFWRQCERETENYQAERMLTYMRKLVEEFKTKNQTTNKKIDKKMLRNYGAKIDYFKGVENWFETINDYVKKYSNNKVKIHHYIISSGLKEILNGVSIKKEFKNIFACEYYFDENGAAKFPTVVVNDTNKTQYLFRINKGKERISESINRHMPPEDRPIPFANMLYIGDGETDVPCMAVVKENGGFAIAVHPPENNDQSENKDVGKKEICEQLWQDKRIDYFFSADYRAGKPLYQRVKIILRMMIARIELNADKDDFANKEKKKK